MAALLLVKRCLEDFDFPVLDLGREDRERDVIDFKVELANSSGEVVEGVVVSCVEDKKLSLLTNSSKCTSVDLRIEMSLVEG